MRLIANIKALAKRHWPALSIRTILLGTFVFVAALPGFGAVFLRVYENTLVQQTEAELIAQGAVLAAAYRVSWGEATRKSGRLQPEMPQIDLRVDPVLPQMPSSAPAPPAKAQAFAIGRELTPIIADASTVTLSATRIMDGNAVVVAGGGDRGRSFAALPEVRRALTGRPVTVLRQRFTHPYGLRSPLEWLSRATNIRVHHVRPVIAGGKVVGLVMLSRSPRGLFLGIYQDRGKILFGVAIIFLALVVLAGILSRGIARPIRQLTRASKNVARGRVIIPEPVATAAIEIRELYANFAVMADRIEVRTRYLRDFAAAVSHEFKTPITGIRGALELLTEHDMDETERRHFLNNASMDVDRLARLVQRMLDLARADMASAGSDQRCDAVAVARQLARERPQVTVQASVEVASVQAAPETLATVLGILTDNSLKAEASSITITINEVPDGISILCIDDGSGIAPGNRARIFEPFFTTGRKEGGTGLGLPIARSLLEANGASLAHLQSDLGTRFDIILLKV